MVERKRGKHKMDPIAWSKKYLKSNPWGSRIYVPSVDGEKIEKKDKFCSICGCKIFIGYHIDTWYCDKCKQYNTLSEEEKEKIRNEIKNKRS